MSFSKELKEELAEIQPFRVHCQNAKRFSYEYLRGASKENPETVLKETCCRKTFLREAFAFYGRITNPEKQYLIEILPENPDAVNLIMRFLLSFGINGKIGTRKGKPYYYIKDAEGVSDFLAALGTTRTLLKLENMRVVKHVRNRINRNVNCETANMKKTVSAGVRDKETILFLKRNAGIENLPAALSEIALLRLENPGLSYEDLGKLLNPPLSKSAVNHRIRRLHEMEDKMKGV